MIPGQLYQLNKNFLFLYKENQKVFFTGFEPYEHLPKDSILLFLLEEIDSFYFLYNDRIVFFKRKDYFSKYIAEIFIKIC
jgi:hypothetical protein